MTNIVLNHLLYQTLIGNMTTGAFSKYPSLHGGIFGRHVKEYKAPLIDKIASSVTEGVDNLKEEPSDERISQITYGLGLKLQEYKSRKELAEGFGWPEGSSGEHGPENKTQEALFVKDVLVFSEPLFQEIYKELTEGVHSKAGHAMHGGSKTLKTMFWGVIYLPYGVAVHSDTKSLDERNLLAKDIGRAIIGRIKSEQDLTEISPSQATAMIAELNLRLEPYWTRTAFKEDYKSSPDRYVSFVSETIKQNPMLENHLYKSLYNNMTVGNFSKYSSLHGGMFGRHVEKYKAPLIEKIALSITEGVENRKGELSDERIAQITSSLGLKLQEYPSREELAKGFGWPELTTGGHGPENKTQEALFVKDVLNISTNETGEAAAFPAGTVVNEGNTDL